HRPLPCRSLIVRHAFPLTLSLALAAAFPAFAQSPAAQSDAVAEAAQRLRADVVAWRRDFHQHPELGNRETRTAARVAEHLRSLGLEPNTGIATTGVT